MSRKTQTKAQKPKQARTTDPLYNETHKYELRFESDRKRIPYNVGSFY